jgi:hypothetical protein
MLHSRIEDVAVRDRHGRKVIVRYRAELPSDLRGEPFHCFSRH